MAAPLEPRTGDGGGGSIIGGALVLYSALGFAGYLWLWLRERSGRIAEVALGEPGLWGSAGIGAAVGFGVSGVLALLTRRFSPFARVESRLAAMIGPLTEAEIIVLALSSSLGEELFFRVAMQDAWGLWPTAIVFGLLHVGPSGLLPWTFMALLLGVGFGWMMTAGYGLLSVTMAHALINYLSLRRMEKR